jgi:NADPH:quinone reductase-like Zn-dependent oxidoreductase
LTPNARGVHNRQNILTILILSKEDYVSSTGARSANYGPQKADSVKARAGIVNAPGAEPLVGWVELPSRSPGATSLQVIAAPLNPLDLLIASGTFHSVRHESPYVPGSECVGVVIDSDRFAQGSLVYAECHASPAKPGSLSTHVLVDDEDILLLPDGLDPIQAAAIGNSGVAAYMPLVEIAEIRPGEHVLILGATGAVGQIAVQIARAKGAARVVGVGRDRAVLEHLNSLGADAVVQLRAGEDAVELTGRLRDVAGAVDVLLDGLYGMPLEAALQVCASQARVVNIGHSAGAVASIPAGVLRGKQLALFGFAGLHTPLKEKHLALSWLWAALKEGTLRVNVKTVSLDELPEAWRGQATSPHAKYVVLPSQDEESRR